jgi:diketogulonate reductase-like aldo/keto reductase
MVLKTATTLRSVGNINIANIDSQVVTSIVLDDKINSIGISKVKMPSVKRFSEEKVKLKGFLTQIKLKIRYKGIKLPIVIDQVAYTGLFLAE